MITSPEVTLIVTPDAEAPNDEPVFMIRVSSKVSVPLTVWAPVTVQSTPGLSTNPAPVQLSAARTAPGGAPVASRELATMAATASQPTLRNVVERHRRPMLVFINLAPDRCGTFAAQMTPVRRGRLEMSPAPNPVRTAQCGPMSVRRPVPGGTFGIQDHTPPHKGAIPRCALAPNGYRGLRYGRTGSRGTAGAAARARPAFVGYDAGRAAPRAERHVPALGFKTGRQRDPGRRADSLRAAPLARPGRARGGVGEGDGRRRAAARCRGRAAGDRGRAPGEPRAR